MFYFFDIKAFYDLFCIHMPSHEISVQKLNFSQWVIFWSKLRDLKFKNDANFRDDFLDVKHLMDWSDWTLRHEISVQKAQFQTKDWSFGQKSRGAEFKNSVIFEIFSFYELKLFIKVDIEKFILYSPHKAIWRIKVWKRLVGHFLMSIWTLLIVCGIWSSQL